MCAEGMDVFAELRGRDYVLWGTGRVARAFYRKYCAERKMLQKPLYYRLHAYKTIRRHRANPDVCKVQARHRVLKKPID